MRPLIEREDGVFLPLLKEELNVEDTLDCGQCFRFHRGADGSMQGVAGSHVLHVVQREDGLLFRHTSLQEVRDFWLPYFDLQQDYAAVKRMLCREKTLKIAINRAGGIRILRQEPFETLISFLISQNNNIPRIKASIERLCIAFGEPVAPGIHAFPTPEQLAKASPEEVRAFGVGYRDTYLVDCARSVAEGGLDLDAIAQMELCEARQTLCTVKGVGPKVAECVLLFGFHRLDAFPVDTWMKKVLTAYYPEGFPEEFRPVAGIAQQYLFHAMRLDKTLDYSRTAG